MLVALHLLCISPHLVFRTNLNVNDTFTKANALKMLW